MCERETVFDRFSKNLSHFRYGLRKQGTDENEDPDAGANANVPHAEDDPDEGVQVLDMDDQAYLPKVRKFVSRREYENYLMFDRRENDAEFHWLWSKGALAEQYTIGASIQIEMHEMEHVSVHVCQIVGH